MAQQASPKVAGQMDDLRAQLTIVSSDVSRIPRSTSAISLAVLRSASPGRIDNGLVIAVAPCCALPAFYSTSTLDPKEFTSP
jgi:hypothetical protein